MAKFDYRIFKQRRSFKSSRFTGFLGIEIPTNKDELSIYNTFVSDDAIPVSAEEILMVAIAYKGIRAFYKGEHIYELIIRIVVNLFGDIPERRVRTYLRVLVFRMPQYPSKKRVYQAIGKENFDKSMPQEIWKRFELLSERTVHIREVIEILIDIQEKYKDERAKEKAITWVIRIFPEVTTEMIDIFIEKVKKRRSK